MDLELKKEMTKMSDLKNTKAKPVQLIPGKEKDLIVLEGVNIGINETLDVIEFFGAVAKVKKAVMADGVINWKDYKHLDKVREAIYALNKAYENYQQIPLELKYIDEAGRDKLIEAAKERFGIQDSTKIASIIDDGLKAAYYTYKAIEAFL